MMQAEVDQVISNLRSIVSAKTNAELARKLGVDQSTISSWRARGKVPKRFLDFLNAPKDQHSELWKELQDSAQSISLARYTMLRHDVAFKGTPNEALALFLDIKPFWLIMYRAAAELRVKMDVLNVDLTTAHALILQEDLRDPEKTIASVAAKLAEDLADNPNLKV